MLTTESNPCAIKNIRNLLTKDWVLSGLGVAVASLSPSVREVVWQAPRDTLSSFPFVTPSRYSLYGKWGGLGASAGKERRDNGLHYLCSSCLRSALPHSDCCLASTMQANLFGFSVAKRAYGDLPACTASV